MKKFKQIVCFIVVALTFSCAFCTPGYAASRLYGNVNGDVDITISDATLIQKHIARLDAASAENAVLADVNADNEIDIKDATCIQKYIAALDGGEKTGEPYYDEFKETQTYSQENPVVSAFLSEVTYDPSDYSTSQIKSYAGQSTAYRKDQPSGLEIPVSSGEIYVSDNYINRSFSETVNSDIYTIYNVAPTSNGGYYFLSQNGELIEGSNIIPTGSLRMIKCPNAYNVRDLGGWVCDGGKVKYGMLFRGGEVSANDRPVLVDFLGVQHDVNLRGKQEVTWTASPLGEDVQFHVYDNYAWYSIENSNLLKSILTDIFDAVINGEPVYFHCSAGADRAGTIALILEALLGMSQSDMDKDYELTCFSTGVENNNQARRRNETEWIGLVNSFSSFSGDTFRDKVVSWVLSLGIPIETINDFRSAMIDGTPEELTIAK